MAEGEPFLTKPIICLSHAYILICPVWLGIHCLTSQDIELLVGTHTPTTLRLAMVPVHALAVRTDVPLYD